MNKKTFQNLNLDEEYSVKLKVKKKNHSEKFVELQWDEKEGLEIESKILGLRNDQVAALCYLVGVEFFKDDIENVVSEIKKNRYNSINLGPLMAEADSKENLLWWVDFFEKSNRNEK